TAKCPAGAAATTAPCPARSDAPCPGPGLTGHGGGLRGRARGRLLLDHLQTQQTCPALDPLDLLLADLRFVLLLALPGVSEAVAATAVRAAAGAAASAAGSTWPTGPSTSSMPSSPTTRHSPASGGPGGWAAAARRPVPLAPPGLPARASAGLL